MGMGMREKERGVFLGLCSDGPCGAEGAEPSG